MLHEQLWLSAAMLACMLRLLAFVSTYELNLNPIPNPNPNHNPNPNPKPNPNPNPNQVSTYELNGVHSSLGGFLLVVLVGGLVEALLSTYELSGRLPQLAFGVLFLLL